MIAARDFAFSLFVFGCCGSAQAALTPGAGQFLFNGWSGPALRVHTYRPQTIRPGAPILFVMHGVRRDADRYRDEFARVAERAGLIVVAPEFDHAQFPGAQNYNLGNVTLDANGRPVIGPDSAFRAIEPLFDEVQRRAGSTRTHYLLYGHSAGAQFVHRFLLFVPSARASLAFVANAGWYTFVADDAFPYGLRGLGIERSTLSCFLRRNAVVLLGTRDISADENLRATPQAMRQGANRLERGRSFHASLQSAAESFHISLGWRLATVDGASHRNDQMAPAILEHLRDADRELPSGRVLSPCPLCREARSGRSPTNPSREFSTSDQAAAGARA